MNELIMKDKESIKKVSPKKRKAKDRTSKSAEMRETIDELISLLFEEYEHPSKKKLSRDYNNQKGDDK